jgi:CRP/FNR family transcriptional regulator, cyclic AMP receptor protein
LHGVVTPLRYRTEVARTGKNDRVDWESILAGIARGQMTLEYGANRNIFRQGRTAESLFYLRRGKVKLAVTSSQGKEAIIAVLDAGEFFGEGCLAGQQLRMATATALTDCSLFRIEKGLMSSLLHQQHEISELFIVHLLSRNIRYEADLVDQLFNSSEKRLARILLLLSHFGKESKAEAVLPRISQDNLAQMVGTTRSRVSHFMNKFRKLGFIDYSDSGGLSRQLWAYGGKIGEFVQGQQHVARRRPTAARPSSPTAAGRARPVAAAPAR